MADSLPEITVNFSNIEEDGLLFAGVAHASEPLSEGMRVLATDHEGHACEARVQSVDGPLAYLALDWDTWTVTEMPETWTVATTGLAVLAGSFKVLQGELAENGDLDAGYSEQSTNLILSS